MIEIGKGVYLVRTQAGFKKAVNAFSDELGIVRGMEVEGFPQSYPSIVSLSVGYKGYEYIQCNNVHLNDVKRAIDESEPDCI